MNRISLERYQVVWYLLAICAGLIAGLSSEYIADWATALLWPVLALLLYCTFVQVPLLHIRDALRDKRFIALNTLGNFILLPLIVWLMLWLVPDNLPLQLGVLLVLLVPCTDWFISFSQLGKANVARAISIAPLNLLLQLLLLPLYLFLMLPDSMPLILQDASVLPAILIVLLPLLLAGLSECWLAQQPQRAVIRDYLAWWPVPLLTLVLFLIAATQVNTVLNSGSILFSAIPVFVMYLCIAALLAKGLGQYFNVPLDQQRTLAFSFGTRNSFVVLPVALALPVGYELAVVVIVLQSLVELFGMVFYLWWLPNKLMK